MMVRSIPTMSVPSCLTTFLCSMGVPN